MSKYIIFLNILCSQTLMSDSSRILAFMPTASISHQVVLRPLTQELAKRGHEVYVITTDPAFTKENAPKNLIEIDVHDVAYATMKKGFAATVTGSSNDVYNQITSYANIILKTFEAEINTDVVQAIIKSKEKFDLLILEACVKVDLVFSHIFKAPVILFSTLPTYDAINQFTGTESHPLLYPSFIHQKINNLTMWDKTKELFKHYYFENLLSGKVENMANEFLKRNFGDDTPSFAELSRNVDMVFLAEHHFWDSNRPVPPSVVYVGGIYPAENVSAELSQDLKTFLDSSVKGVIYMSLGTNIKPSSLPRHFIEVITNVFSQLPYDILLRWDDEKSMEFTKNVKIVKWVPQTNLLKHANVRLFIMQGGLQSIEDAINGGVPMIGMPMLADQWFNVEQCVRLGIGLRLDIESVTEQTLLSAIATAIDDTSYRSKVVTLRNIVKDQPQSALERAVWWSEYVIRHKGAPHLRAPGALMTNWDYYELNLIFTVLFCAFVLVSLVICLIYALFLSLPKSVKNKNKIKDN